MKVLSSPRNPKVMQAASLSRARHRRASGRHLAEGPNAVVAALGAGLAETVFATDEGLRILKARLGSDVVHAGGAEFLTVTEAILSRMADAVTPQPIAAIVVTPGVDLADVEGDMVVVLDTMADPGNVGTLIRTAHALGIDAVVLVDGADPYGPKAVRASAGSVYGLPIVTAPVDEVAAWAARQSRILIGLHADAAQPIDALRTVPRPCALMVGNEARGLSADLQAYMAHGVAIGMYGAVDSLNAAVAGAIAMYVLTAGSSDPDAS